MLQALELENFKAFGKRAHIPLAPITLIFGENSAGKSSILHALYLLKQTMESRDTGPVLLPQADFGYVDLGNFQDMLFDHDLERMISIRLVTSLGDEDFSRLTKEGHQIAYLLTKEYNKIAIEFCFSRPSLEEGILLDEIGIYDGESSDCIALYEIVHESKGMSMSLDELQQPRPLNLARCKWLTQEPRFWEPSFKYNVEHKEGTIEFLKWRIQNLLSDKPDEEAAFFPDDSLYELKEWKEFLLSDYDLESYIAKMHKEEMNHDVSLGIHLFLPAINYSKSVLFGTSFSSSLALMISNRLQLILKQLFPMSPVRRLSKRSYNFRGTDPKDVGYEGDLLPHLLFRNTKLVGKTNYWFQKLNIGYELEIRTIGEDALENFEIRLIDTRRKKPVNVGLLDVGFGISQLLPFVVQSLVSEKRIISIEQPEVHIHPKLQADLGDLLVECIREPQQNQFIVETHSEHLILRLQRRIREGKIKPCDVSVIYISRRPDGAKVERLHLDEDGDFIDDWPDGFFPERLRELI